MENIAKHFAHIHSQYVNQKPGLYSALERLKRRKRWMRHKQAKRLLDELERCDKELSTTFENPEWKNDKILLKIKIETLEHLFKEVQILLSSSWKKWLEVTLVIFMGVFIVRNFLFGIYQCSSPSAQPTVLVGDRVLVHKYAYLFTKPQVGDVVMIEQPDFVYDQTNKFYVWWQRYIGFSLFKIPRGPEYIIKRIVAAPGDTIEGAFEQGRPVVYRNGKHIEELYVNRLPFVAITKKVGFFDEDSHAPDVFKARQKQSFYVYDPQKDFDEQPFYQFDYANMIGDPRSGEMRLYGPYSKMTGTEKTGEDIFGPQVLGDNSYWLMGDARRSSIDSRKWGGVSRQKIIGKVAYVAWSLDSEEPIWFFELLKHPVAFWKKVRVDRFFKRVN